MESGAPHPSGGVAAMGEKVYREFVNDAEAKGTRIEILDIIGC